MFFDNSILTNCLETHSKILGWKKGPFGSTGALSLLSPVHCLAHMEFEDVEVVWARG
jgi:hypothetical protein